MILDMDAGGSGTSALCDRSTWPVLWSITQADPACVSKARAAPERPVTASAATTRIATARFRCPMVSAFICGQPVP